MRRGGVGSKLKAVPFFACLGLKITNLLILSCFLFLESYAVFSHICYNSIWVALVTLLYPPPPQSGRNPDVVILHPCMQTGCKQACLQPLVPPTVGHGACERCEIPFPRGLHGLGKKSTSGDS